MIIVLCSGYAFHICFLQEFLKKEYSHENIYFWTACERYKRLTDPDQLGAMAKVILERHLVTSAPEPVNVDSQARQHAQDGLQNPNQMLFAQVYLTCWLRGGTFNNNCLFFCIYISN